MLLNLTVENWMSYRAEASLSMVASLERQHAESLAKIAGFRSKKALPVAAIYGGNASGKTNLFRALSALRQIVVADPGIGGSVPVSPFLLEGGDDKPVMFDITFLTGKIVYRLVVEAVPNAILYESLERVRESGTEDVYERVHDNGDTSYNINYKFFKDNDHVFYAAKSTRANRLFLGSAVSQNIEELVQAYSWFTNALELVGVESQAWSFARCATRKEGFLDYASSILSQLDTGIDHLTSEIIGLDALPSDVELRSSVDRLGSDELITMVSERSAGDYGFEMITVRVEDGQPIAERLRTVHKGTDGKEVSFPLSMESSGTQRLMGLLPMLFDLVGSGGAAGEKVYVVDELDRCLHTMLTKKLVADFLGTCGPHTRKQLLFTTHDLLLMDQSLLRRDEMYVTERGADGRSELIGLSEYKDLRYDKDLVRSYLDGRFGGVPMLGEAGSRG